MACKEHGVLVEPSCAAVHGRVQRWWNRYTWLLSNPTPAIEQGCATQIPRLIASGDVNGVAHAMLIRSSQSLQVYTLFTIASS